MPDSNDTTTNQTPVINIPKNPVTGYVSGLNLLDTSKLTGAERRAAEAPVQFSTTDGAVFDFDKIMAYNNIDYGMSRMSFDESIQYYNVARLPDYNNMAMPYIGTIIFTRPSLNLFPSTADPYKIGESFNPAEAPDPAKNFVTLLSESKTAGFAYSQEGVSLVKMLCEYKDPAHHTQNDYYMPLFTNRATSYTTADVGLKSVDKAQTYYGHVIKYGHYSEEHKFGGTISIDFRNDRYWSILKTCYLWMSYIHMVSKTDKVKPTLENQMNAIIDYCGSIYYLVTLMDGRTLVYWEKLTGVYPKTVPFGMFGYEDAPKVEDKVTIEFDYGIKSEPCDPMVLYDLNVLSLANSRDYGLRPMDVWNNGIVAGYSNKPYGCL